jgi:hypothetical protein
MAQPALARPATSIEPARVTATTAATDLKVHVMDVLLMDCELFEP